MTDAIVSFTPYRRVNFIRANGWSLRADNDTTSVLGQVCQSQILHYSLERYRPVSGTPRFTQVHTAPQFGRFSANQISLARTTFGGLFRHPLSSRSRGASNCDRQVPSVTWTRCCHSVPLWPVGMICSVGDMMPVGVVVPLGFLFLLRQSSNVLTARLRPFIPLADQHLAAISGLV